jgi:hypothetical protein
LLKKNDAPSCLKKKSVEPIIIDLRWNNKPTPQASHGTFSLAWHIARLTLKKRDTMGC